MVRFTKHGRLVHEENEVVFNEECKRYYRLATQRGSLSEQIANYREIGWLVNRDQESVLEKALLGLWDEIENSSIAGLTEGSAFPFFLPSGEGLGGDLGSACEDVLFPALKTQFEGKFGSLHFRASLQGKISLPNFMRPESGGGQANLVEALASDKAIAGWIFPEALIEYSLSSQIAAYKRLNGALSDGNFQACLGGVLDVGSALLGTPNMLINEETYPPVLCLSGICHEDGRYTFNFKSYGNHLEFWGMPRALTLRTEQVSEQWSGVVSVFKDIG